MQSRIGAFHHTGRVWTHDSTQRQTAVTAYFSSGRLLLFVPALRHCLHAIRTSADPEGVRAGLLQAKQVNRERINAGMAFSLPHPPRTPAAWSLYHTGLQCQMAVTAHLESKQLLPFGFARQHRPPPLLKAKQTQDVGWTFSQSRSLYVAFLSCLYSAVSQQE